MEASSCRNPLGPDGTGESQDIPGLFPGSVQARGPTHTLEASSMRRPSLLARWFGVPSAEQHG